MSTQPLDRNFYIACLNLKGRRCLVVGAGPVALEKIDGLLACSADVHVVAEKASAEVESLAATGALSLSVRRYKSGDLDGAFLVVAATSDPTTQERIYEDAERRSMLVNVVDVPGLCNFILPAIVRIGPIAIAISTSGASPALAKRMKSEIGDAFGPEHARLAEMLNQVRDWSRRTLPTYRDRRDFFEGIVNGEPDPIVLLREGRESEVRELIERAQVAASDRFTEVGA